MPENRPITGSTDHAWRGLPHKPHPSRYNECLYCQKYYDALLDEVRYLVFGDDPFGDVMERTHSG